MWSKLGLFAKDPRNPKWLSPNFSEIEPTLESCISQFMRIFPGLIRQNCRAMIGVQLCLSD
jgi:hypothetical protein